MRQSISVKPSQKLEKNFLTHRIHPKNVQNVVKSPISGKKGVTTQSSRQTQGDNL